MRFLKFKAKGTKKRKGKLNKVPGNYIFIKKETSDQVDCKDTEYISHTVLIIVHFSCIAVLV